MLQESIAGLRGSPATTDLVLERLPSGEFAWLRPDATGSDSDSRRVALTQRGYDLLARWRAERWLFGREVSA